MPDISKCKNERCPLKLECFRYTSKPNDFWQSYTTFEFKTDESGKIFCDNQIKLDGHTI